MICRAPLCSRRVNSSHGTGNPKTTQRRTETTSGDSRATQRVNALVYFLGFLLTLLDKMQPQTQNASLSVWKSAVIEPPKRSN